MISRKIDLWWLNLKQANNLDQLLKSFYTENSCFNGW